MKQQFAAQTFFPGLASAEKESTNKRSSTASLQDPDPVERTCDWPWEEPTARCWRVRWVSALLPAQSLALLPYATD